MNPVKAGLSTIYAAAAAGKNLLYDKRILETIHVGRPVISIGNLTVGGTGKTPVVDMVTRLLLQHGHHPGIVCRNYRGSGRRAERVEPSHPEIFGDEACWYASRHPGLPVWAGPSKSESAKAVAEKENVDVILIDDGYQHRRLHRDMNILLLDATDERSAYHPLPWGRGREAWENHRRADAIILTKTNLAKPGRVEKLKADLGDSRPVFEMTSQLRPVDLPKIGPFLLVSGIARPESFHALVDHLLPDRRKETLSFVDHHRFTMADVKTIQLMAAQHKACAVLITEKDATKLTPLWHGNLPLIPLSLEVNLKQSVESFYDVVRRAFASHS